MSADASPQPDGPQLQAAQTGLSGGGLTLVWTGLALLVTAQVCEVLGVRRRRSETAS